MGHNNPLSIRSARHSDIDAIAEFHVRVWRHTYQNIAPDSALQTLDKQHRIPQWQSKLHDPAQHTQLALLHDKLVGVVSLGPASNRALGAGGEINHLYVDPEHKRMGIGKTLLRYAIDESGNSGFATVALAVVRENQSAIDFYRSMDGRQSGAFIDAGPLWKSANLVFSWNTRIPPAQK